MAETFRRDVEVFYTLGEGPRQVGKTTLLKLKTKEMLGSCVDVRRSFYWACGRVEG